MFQYPTIVLGDPDPHLTHRSRRAFGTAGVDDLQLDAGNRMLAGSRCASGCRYVVVFGGQQHDGPCRSR